jgi:hypothetical protein
VKMYRGHCHVPTGVSVGHDSGVEEKHPSPTINESAVVQTADTVV